MRNIHLVFFISLVILNAVVPAEASAGKNLKDGLGMIIASPKRIAQKIAEETRLEEFKPVGVALGFFKGMVYTLADFIAGIARVMTFPVDFDPKNDNSSWSDYTLFEGDIVPEKTR